MKKSTLCAALAAVFGAALPAAAWADAPDGSQAPFARVGASQPAAVEASTTMLRLPNGQRVGLLGMNYYVAVTDDWGFGPSAYGAAQGHYGGLITFGATAQRRWRLSDNTHFAASLYVGAGGGLSSQQVHFGGGLMLRPEISIRTEVGAWYVGTSLSYVSFPSGNVRGGGLGVVVGRSLNFNGFLADDVDKPGRTSARTGLGFDEVTLFGSIYSPRAGSLNRSGEQQTGHMGAAGAELRQYFVPGSWWGIEAAGAAHGGADGYMQGMAVAGQDWALGTPNLRVGAELGLGLGGGGNVDTGNGWLWRAGPTLRWITPWGVSVQMDAGLLEAISGRFSVSFVRAGLALPLDFGAIGRETDSGIVREQSMSLGVEHLSRVRFKDGSVDAISPLVLTMVHELSPSWYGVAQAGSAAWGHAGAYSIGLFGLGVQSPVWQRWRVGAEALVGAAGGGGVDVSGGAVAQGQMWAQWQGERLRLRAGVGRWRTLRSEASDGQASPLVELSLGYAYGVLAR